MVFIKKEIKYEFNNACNKLWGVIFLKTYHTSIPIVDDSIYICIVKLKK